MATPTNGGQGDAPSRSDLALAALALRQDWPIPPAVKRQLLQRAIDIADVEHLTGALASQREVIAALRVIAAFGNTTLKQQALDLARAKFERETADQTAVKARDVVAEMQAAADQYEREHGSDSSGAPGVQDGPGPVQHDDPGEG